MRCFCGLIFSLKVYLLGGKNTDFNSFSCFLPISYTADQLNGECLLHLCGGLLCRLQSWIMSNVLRNVSMLCNSVLWHPEPGRNLVS